MRADRLLSILMILQHRGKVTAGALARELEVSERTIYRDISALSTAGVPVYSESGPEGGFSLVDHYRTTLTGLSEPEVRALFMLSIPAPLKELGLSQELKTALYKLAAALPGARRQEEISVRQRIHLDAAWWGQGQTPTPHLPVLYQAAWADRQVALVYPTIPNLSIEQVVEPYGLVAKAGVWYLVYRPPARPWQVLRVSTLLSATLLDIPFARDPAFDLPSFWSAWCTEVAQRQAQYQVRARFSPAILPALGRLFSPLSFRLVVDSATDGANDYAQHSPRHHWPIYDLSFESLEDARERLLGLGAAVEVLSPFPLRCSIQDVAAQTAHLYAS